MRRRGSMLTVVAGVLVFVALCMPDTTRHLGPATLLRIPIEAVVGAVLLVLLPDRRRRIGAVVLGAGLGLLVVFKALDMGFISTLDRRFDPIADWTLVRDGIEFLSSTSGRASAIGAVAGAVVLAVVLPVLLALAVLRLARAAAGHRRSVLRGAGGIGLVWLICALTGVQIVPPIAVAGRNSAAEAVRVALRVPAGIHDRREFAAEVADDPFGATPGGQLLTGLAGKDVVLTFVESYGRIALEDPVNAPATRAMLDHDTAALRSAGWSARSGWLTSATYAGGSWLGHSTLLAGVWVNSQQRYDHLVTTDRMTLNAAFRKAGWRTVDVAPGTTRRWPEGAYYGYDKIYAEKDLGYRGEAFSWATMPDQYTLSRFEQLVYGRPHRQPLMAQLTLVSSHNPWTPLPRTVGWDQIGDGSIFATPAAREGGDRASIKGEKAVTQAQYALSIRYSVGNLVDWLRRYGTDDTVLIFLGDHQPAAIVSGQDASHDVPITIVAHDPDVLDKISGWGWADGLRPTQQTPVWPMSTFRDRFLTAFRN